MHRWFKETELISIHPIKPSIPMETVLISSGCKLKNIFCFDLERNEKGQLIWRTLDLVDGCLLISRSCSCCPLQGMIISKHLHACDEQSALLVTKHSLLFPVNIGKWRAQCVCICMICDYRPTLDSCLNDTYLLIWTAMFPSLPL